MTSTLRDAWNWYLSARKLAQLANRLGLKHWDALPWEDGDLGKDDKLKELTSATLISQSKDVLAELDDLCILLLFSVFEAAVRTRVLADVNAELPSLRHPFVRGAIGEIRDDIEFGKFARVVDPYKTADHDLVEQVKQIRLYRNWVAHGRRGAQPVNIEPRQAYQRLNDFLDFLATATELDPDHV